MAWRTPGIIFHMLLDMRHSNSSSSILPRPFDMYHVRLQQQGRVVLLNGLVKQDVSLNYVDASNPYLTPLIAASANGREECVRIILQCPGVQVSCEKVHHYLSCFTLRNITS